MIWLSNTKILAHIKPILLTQTITNTVYVSRTNIYRANSPTIYACVMNLNFIAYIVKNKLWESLHYIYNHAKHNKDEMHERQTLKNKPILSRKPFPLKPSKLLPH